jgi:hypothetical protein
VKCMMPRSKLDVYLRESEAFIDATLKIVSEESAKRTAAGRRLEGAKSKADAFASHFILVESEEETVPARANHAHGLAMEARGELELAIQTHEHSLRLAAASLLQIAKQGISFAVGNPDAAQSGRMIRGVSLRDLIVQGRNQSLHFEEKKPHSAVREMFGALENELGDRFSLTKRHGESLAAEVLELLGWKSYDNIKRDLISLMPVTT